MVVSRGACLGGVVVAVAIGCGTDPIPSLPGGEGSTTAEPSPTGGEGTSQDGTGGDGSSDDDGVFTECSDPLPPAVLDCSGGGSQAVGLRVRASEYLGTEPMACSVFAVTSEQSTDWGVREIGLGCEDAGSGFDGPVQLRLTVPLDSATPLRPGQRVELQLVHGDEWFEHSLLSVRDPDTGALLLAGLNDTDYTPPPELFAPLTVGHRREVCEFVEIEDDCFRARAPFVFDIEYEGRVTTVHDGTSATFGDFVVHAEALEYLDDCWGQCADVRRSHATLLASPDFDQPEPAGCDLFAQDCGAGQRCVPASSDGEVWDLTVCVPEGALGPGEDCVVAPSEEPADECGPGLVCVPSPTNPGQASCEPLCTGSLDAPQCDPGTICNLDPHGAAPPVTCVPTCNPNAGDCSDPEEGCYWWPSMEAFVCVNAGELVEGDECEYINDCGPGLFCANGEALDACTTLGCCARTCFVSAPDCAPGQHCAAFFGDEPLPGYEDFGVCVDMV